MIYFDFSDIPAGATIESAWLIVSPVVWSRIPCAPGAGHAATLDIWSADAAWLQAPTSETCGGAPGSEHWRRTSWNYADVADEVRWNPSLSRAGPGTNTASTPCRSRTWCPADTPAVTT